MYFTLVYFTLKVWQYKDKYWHENPKQELRPKLKGNLKPTLTKNY